MVRLESLGRDIWVDSGRDGKLLIASVYPVLGTFCWNVIGVAGSYIQVQGFILNHVFMFNSGQENNVQSPII